MGVGAKSNGLVKFLVRDEMRKKLLVDKELQPFMVKAAMLFTFLTAAIVEIGHQIFFWSFRSQAVGMGISPDHLFFKFIDAQSTRLLWVTGAMVFVVMCVAGFLVLQLSNKVAGPIYHLREHLKRVGSGQKNADLKFRENDFFQDIPELINKLGK